MGDFETTVYDGQAHTEVWASAIVEFGTEDVAILHSIDDTFDYLRQQSGDVCVYYHNLKFDGAFWIDYLMTKLHYKQALFQKDNTTQWYEDDEMQNESFKFLVSSMGQWYSITIKIDGRFIDIRDSLKLLPFTVRKIGESFGTKHKKLDMEYKGYRYAGCEITDKEKHYIANDVLVVKEALEIMFSQGHKKLTIGACCLDEFKSGYTYRMYREMFPDLTEIDCPFEGFKNADEYIRRAYRGGWCYLVKGKEMQVKSNGTTADVNSLYPSMMSKESGNRYPIGRPHWFKGKPREDIEGDEYSYYFIRIKCRFYIKDGHLPFIQLKGNYMYQQNESLITSDLYDKETGLYYSKYTVDGVEHDTAVEMTMTMTDFELFKEHYNIVDLVYIDGCAFLADIGIFDEYMLKYKKIKETSKGATRELAKLFLNNLYGKMASSTNSSFKTAYIKEDGSIGFDTVLANDKKAGYIAIGSAITSYARNFTIRAAQLNYHGVNERGFIYADTDSIHCDLSPNELVGIKVHPTDFCAWKLESCWDTGYFTRQKTYIEHITHENLNQLEEPYYNIKCAGMPETCKQIFNRALMGDKGILDGDDKDDEETIKFLQAKDYTLDDFKIGLVIGGKLMPKRIKGGVLLVETSYEMR